MDSHAKYHEKNAGGLMDQTGKAGGTHSMRPSGLTDEYFASIGKTPEEAQQIQSEFSRLETQLQDTRFRDQDTMIDILDTLRTWWDFWQHHVHWTIRWLVYGILLGLLVYAVLQGIGFTAGGVAAKSLAAGIQAGIGNVEAGSVFAALQSIGTASIISFGAVGAVIGEIVGALTNMRGEDDHESSI